MRLSNVNDRWHKHLWMLDYSETQAWSDLSTASPQVFQVPRLGALAAPWMIIRSFVIYPEPRAALWERTVLPDWCSHRVGYREEFEDPGGMTTAGNPEAELALRLRSSSRIQMCL